MDLYTELQELYSFDCTTLNAIIEHELKNINDPNVDLQCIAENIHKKLPQFTVDFVYNLIVSFK